MDWNAITLSLKLAALTTLVLFVAGLPVAYWLATSHRRWKFLVEAVVALPLVLPPTVLGFYILLALGPRSTIGQFYETLTGHRLPFSFQGLLVASVLYSLPFTVQPFTAAFAAVDPKLVEASWCLGESRAATFFRVILPLSWPGVLTGMILSFAHTIGESAWCSWWAAICPASRAPSQFPFMTPCRVSTTRRRARLRSCCS